MAAPIGYTDAFQSEGFLPTEANQALRKVGVELLTNPRVLDSPAVSDEAREKISAAITRLFRELTDPSIRRIEGELRSLILTLMETKSPEIHDHLVQAHEALVADHIQQRAIENEKRVNWFAMLRLCDTVKNRALYRVGQAIGNQADFTLAITHPDISKECKKSIQNYGKQVQQAFGKSKAVYPLLRREFKAYIFAKMDANDTEAKDAMITNWLTVRRENLETIKTCRQQEYDPSRYLTVEDGEFECADFRDTPKNRALLKLSCHLWVFQRTRRLYFESDIDPVVRFRKLLSSPSIDEPTKRLIQKELVDLSLKWTHNETAACEVLRFFIYTQMESFPETDALERAAGVLDRLRNEDPGAAPPRFSRTPLNLALNLMSQRIRKLASQLSQTEENLAKKLQFLIRKIQTSEIPEDIQEGFIEKVNAIECVHFETEILELEQWLFTCYDGFESKSQSGGSESSESHRHESR